MKKRLLSLSIGLLLAGCASRQYTPELRYVAPADAAMPPATLQSKFSTHLGRHESQSLQILDDISCKPQRVFYAWQSSGQAPAPVPVEAGHVITLVYTATLPGERSCTIYAGMIFESGKTYSVSGGNNVLAGVADYFKNRTCSFSIVDESTKQVQPLLDKTHICGK